MLFLMAAVNCCSTVFKWATLTITDSIRVTAIPTVSTNFSGYMRGCYITELIEIYENIAQQHFRCQAHPVYNIADFIPVGSILLRTYIPIYITQVY
jgi:hypothetical protein